MKASFLLAVLSSYSLASAAQTKPVLYPQLSKTLDSLAYVDQWPMQRLMQQQPDSAGRDLFQVEKDNFARHQPVLEKLVRRYSYPGFRQVGEKSSGSLWLLVQHADAHPDFQRQVLKLMLPEVKKKNASPSNYAYLTDRVALAAGQPQDYGTQVEFASVGHSQPRNLRDPANVDKRRATMGMGTLEAYLEQNNKLNLEMNKPKVPSKEEVTSVITVQPHAAWWPCKVTLGGQRFAVDHIRRYRRGLLMQFDDCASEGLFTLNFPPASYSPEDEAVKKLLLKRQGNQVVYFGKTYQITQESADSILVKAAANSYLIFVGNISQ